MIRRTRHTGRKILLCVLIAIIIAVTIIAIAKRETLSGVTLAEARKLGITKTDLVAMIMASD